MENNEKEDLKNKVSRIEKLQEKMNKMEFVTEVEKAGIRELAEKVYYDSLTAAINREIAEAIDKIGTDPLLRIEVANEILIEMGLDPITSFDCTNEQVLDEYLSRF